MTSRALREDSDSQRQSVFPDIQRDIEDRPRKSEVQLLISELKNELLESQNSQLKWIIGTAVAVLGIVVVALVAVIVAFC